MTWNDVAKIIIALLLSGSIGIIFKILYDWLKSGRNNHKISTECEHRISVLEQEIKTVKKSEIEQGSVKTSVVKIEVILSELIKKFDKLESSLEKNFDEIYTRLRDLEKGEK